MINETSYGVIPLRKREDWEVFLVQHQKGHWSFPKGHAEKAETPEGTARRELLEETGLTIDRLLQSHPLKEEYRFRYKGTFIDKTVYYFIAEVSGEIKLQQEEIKDGRWFSFRAAELQASYLEVKELVRQVESLLLS